MSMLIDRLRAIQQRCGFLPKREVVELAKETDTPLHRLHEVISFFPHFRYVDADPKPNVNVWPEVEVHVCRDMACHMRGAGDCLTALRSIAGEFGGEKKVKVESVSCLGRCDRAPAVLVEFNRPGQPDQKRVLERPVVGDYAARLRTIVAAHLASAEVPPDPADRSPLAGRIDPYAANAAMPRPLEPYAAARQFASALKIAGDDAARKAAGDGLVETLKTSDLRGMGGAGRPAFSKWSEVREESKRADATYVICNGDESEPSTFKDREILLRAPHLVVEGMVLAALLVGAHQGYVYIRHEYFEQIHAVEREIARARELGAVGDDVLGSGLAFNLDVFESPGGYVCGEQSALIEAIEEHRAEPRNRPPAIEANGLFAKPTLLNNVETFAWVPAIMLEGGEWYRDAGLKGTPWYAARRKEGGKGLRLFSICGDVVRPGVYEVPVGTTLGALIDMAGGICNGLPLLAFAPSGPSGGFLPTILKPEGISVTKRRNFPAGRSELDIREIPLDKVEYDDLGLMLGAGLLVIADAPGRDLHDLALNASRFFRNESCGKCVPCRVGSEKLVKIAERFGATPPPRKEERDSLADLIRELQSVMEQTSICGLGTSASKPMASLFEHDWKLSP
jgi:NADH:ubiquinone oxidoreductase subunit F (NADH-binding)/NADH:ubiquinone oxidoreductase subunit E